MQPEITIAVESPLSPDLGHLFACHEAEGNQGVPPESNHMLDPSALAVPEARFFVIRRGDEPVGMGAIKTFAPGQGEVKSMHVLATMRGHGLSRRLMQVMIDSAKASGLKALYLETGTQPVFVAARALYQRMGFEECAPFGEYQLDPNSIFMTLPLKQAATS